MDGEVYNEDCLKTMSRMADGMVDLVVTSPPYNMRTRVLNNKYVRRTEGEDSFTSKYSEFDDALHPDEFHLLHKNILSELLRVSKIIAYNIQIVTGSKSAFFRLMGDFHEQIKDVMIWDKTPGQPAMQEGIINPSFEMVLLLEGDGRIGRRITNAKFERGTLDGVFRCPKTKCGASGHQAAFPELLPEIFIRNFSNEGDLIYDPFMGTGTTAVVAKRMSRRFVGSEISEKYCSIASERLNKTYAQMEIVFT